MIELNPAHWYEERRYARDYRDQFLKDWATVIQQYTGPGYRSNSASATRVDNIGTHDPENHAQEWLSLVPPQMTASNPRSRVKTARAGDARKGALAMQYALNRWVRMTDMRSTNEKMAVDYGLKYCIAAVFPKPMPGMKEVGDPATMPSMRRISPDRYLQDPKALEFEDQRWRSHGVLEDKDDLLKRARAHPEDGWNIEEIKSLPVGEMIDETRGMSNSPLDVSKSLDRQQLAYEVIWVPEYQPDPKKGPKQGYNGALLTLGIGSAYGTGDKDRAAWLRDPIPYFGPRWGPYQTCGAYVVPDDATPMSPIGATAAQADHLNAIARAIQRSVEDYKRIALVSNGDPEIETIVAEGQHGFVYTVNVDDLRKNVMELELGGLSQQFLAAEQRARDSLDRNTGLPDAMRGNVQGGATATEINAAMQGGGIRVSHHTDKFRRFLSRTLRTVAWYLEFDNNIPVYQLGPDAVAAMQDEFGHPTEEVWMAAGLGQGQSYDDFDDMDFEIDLYSMERTTEQQQTALAQELDFLILQLGPMMSDPRMQHVRWEEYLAQRGELRGIEGYGRLFDMEAARKLARKMAQIGNIQPSANSTPPQPRLAADIAGASAPRKTNSGIDGLNHKEPKSSQPSKDLARSTP